MKASSGILLTGATGFLGSNILLRLLEDNDREIFLFVRGADKNERLNKLLDALKKANNYQSSPFDLEERLLKIPTFDYDLMDPSLKIKSDSLDFLRGKVSHFIHSAAMLSHLPAVQDAVYQSNVIASNATYSLASQIQASHFLYISTAYVCGEQEGYIAAQPYTTQRRFNNYYEESKCLAEELLLSSCENNKTQLTIFRPSVITGDSKTYATCGSDSGIYGLYNKLERLKHHMRLSESKIRLPAKPKVKPNLIPVDHIINDLFCVLDFSSDKKIFVSCTNSESLMTVEDILTTMLEALGLPLDTFEYQDTEITDVTAIERLVHRAIEYFIPYMNLQPTFENNIPQINIGAPQSISGQIRIHAAQYEKYPNAMTTKMSES